MELNEFEKKPKPHFRFVIRSIVEFLKENRFSFNLDEVLEQVKVLGQKMKIENLKQKEFYIEKLKNHHCLNFNETDLTFSYKPRLEKIKNANDIIRHLESNKCEIEENFFDTYPKVKYDLKELKSSGKIVSMPLTNTKKKILFKNPIQLNFDVDEQSLLLWESVECSKNSINDTLDFMRKELLLNGHKIFTEKAKKLENIQQKPKNRKRSSRYKINLTNKHLKDKLKIYQQIDK